MVETLRCFRSFNMQPDQSDGSRVALCGHKSFHSRGIGFSVARPHRRYRRAFAPLRSDDTAVDVPVSRMDSCIRGMQEEI